LELIEKKNGNNKLDNADKTAITTGAISGAVATTGVVATGLGFTSTGIAAASTAAGIQTTIGNVAAGSLFATLQSLGATGALVGMGIAGGVSLIAVGAAFGIYKLVSLNKK
jgi:hypothetical protein